MKMKKNLAILLGITLLVGLTGCASNQAPEQADGQSAAVATETEDGTRSHSEASGPEDADARGGV